MNEDIILALFAVIIYVFAMTFASARVAPYLRTILDLRRQRRRGIRRRKREEESEIQRLGRRVKALDRLAKQVEKNMREKQSKEERRQLPISNYAKDVSDEALYAPNLGNVGDPTTDAADDVADTYRSTR